MAEETRAIFSVTGPDMEPSELVVTTAGIQVGRTANNDLTLAYAQISRHHLRLQIEGETVYATDLKSSGGTFLNETRLEAEVKTSLAVGDSLRLGPFVLMLRELVLPESEPEPTPRNDVHDTLETFRVSPDKKPDGGNTGGLEDVDSTLKTFGSDVTPPKNRSPLKDTSEMLDSFQSTDDSYRIPWPIEPESVETVEAKPTEEAVDVLLDDDEFDAKEEESAAESPGAADDTSEFAPVAPSQLPRQSDGPDAPPTPPSQPALESEPSEPEPKSRERALIGGNQGSGTDEVVKAAQQVQFSAYYPREMQPDDWRPLQAYVFKSFAADQVKADAERQIGPLTAFRRIIESARRVIPEGELITAQPHLPGFQFNPPAATIGFYEDWHRFEFKLRAKDAPLNQAANGFLTFTTNGIIVADIPLSVFVTAEANQTTPQPTTPQPMYDTVFASYSHRDMQIVEKVEAAAKALGMTYLRDVVTLRSGQHWSEELLRMIDDATIFQLFWSETAAQSPYCQQEWEYALKLNRDHQYFIRPVYWAMPMPDPPANLQHLHFAYQPDLVK